MRSHSGYIITKEEAHGYAENWLGRVQPHFDVKC